MVGLCITSQNESIPMFIKSKMNKLDYSLTMKYYATMKKTITTTCNTTTNIEVRHKKKLHTELFHIYEVQKQGKLIYMIEVRYKLNT